MRSRTFALLAAALLAGACGDATEPRVPTGLELSETALNLERFDTVTLAATVLDQHGRAYAAISEGYAITWSSSAPQIADVSEGTIVAASPGSATITARAGNLPPVKLPVQVVPRTYSGQLSFDYAGHRSGSFAVSSSFEFLASGNPNVASFAFATYEAEHDDQDFMAVSQRADGLFDALHFWVDQRVTTTGTRAVSDGMLFLGLGPAAVEDAYWVSSGSVQITTVSDRRLVGTFTMSLEHAEFGTALNLTGGTFDLPEVPEAEFESSASVASLSASPAAGSASRGTISPQQLYEAVARRR
jgi:hypothetical protein